MPILFGISNGRELSDGALETTFGVRREQAAHLSAATPHFDKFSPDVCLLSAPAALAWHRRARACDGGRARPGRWGKNPGRAPKTPRKRLKCAPSWGKEKSGPPQTLAVSGDQNSANASFLRTQRPSVSGQHGFAGARARPSQIPEMPGTFGEFFSGSSGPNQSMAAFLSLAAQLVFTVSCFAQSLLLDLAIL